MMKKLTHYITKSSGISGEVDMLRGLLNTKNEENVRDPKKRLSTTVVVFLLLSL